VASFIKLVVGLGNPTAKYERTRHNAGFWFLDEIAKHEQFSFVPDDRFRGLIARVKLDDEPLFLLKPMTYMNHSGEAVASLARYYRIMPEEIMVAHDDLDFTPGMVRLKKGGGHGGHKGLRDIITGLGSGDFYRLRIGIGHPGTAAQVVSYVLERPNAEDETRLRLALQRAVDVFPDLVRGKFQGAMNFLHQCVH
jgi:PTH1 family peptidyl-tRNA hydrolase